MTRDNNATLIAHQAEIDAIAARDGLQAAIDYANSIIDVSQGIVGGDGSYWPRLAHDGSDPFNL